MRRIPDNIFNKLLLTLIILTAVIFFIFFLLKIYGSNTDKNRFDQFKLVKADTQNIASSCDSKTVDSAEIIIKNLILKEIEKHKGLQVIINASEGKIIHSDDKIECIKIKCFLSNKNKNIATLAANKAIINKTSKNILLSGDTIVHLGEITMTSQDVFYNYSGQILNTKKQTLYNHPNFSILAQQSTIDLKKDEIFMNGGVKSEISNYSTSNRNSD